MGIDWRFDVGLRDNKFEVDAWCSSIPDKRFEKLTREDLKALRREINQALRNYPQPSNKEAAQ